MVRARAHPWISNALAHGRKRLRAGGTDEGFTLIELVVVMIIVGIVIGIAVNGLMAVRRTSHDPSYSAGAGQVWSAVLGYRLDNQGRMPPAPLLANGGAGLKDPANVPYVHQWPDDPTGTGPLPVSSGGGSPTATGTPNTVRYATTGTTGWLVAYGGDGSLIFSRAISQGGSPGAPVG